ncbi:GNAT family N-acetyltransferase [Solimicrobium silvestre]|uniref:Acetyltransferase (GNAT) domain n=1 Tax=Solimicrobium silvestre TaxID=2099400 RepID=A0A2S9GYY8_9BURK|nr:Acetyltransferase (GNAT) domain [Solimicrobium silvestre]
MQAITLTGRYVTLEPLAQEHLTGLQAAAADGQLWNLFFTGVPTKETTQQWLDTALALQADKKALPFVVRENSSGEIVGTTRYCNIEMNHKRLEIGFTWYAKRVQRGAVNTECKLLLLRHAFEQLECNVVEFRTDWFNQTSQRAIERLGAKRDGVLRNHVIAPNGRVKDTVVYSILNNEWNGIQEHLRFKLERHSASC